MKQKKAEKSMEKVSWECNIQFFSQYKSLVGSREISRWQVYADKSKDMHTKS